MSYNTSDGVILNCSFGFHRFIIQIYQRIERLIGKKLPLFETVENDVMLLVERVEEAQKLAKRVRVLIWILIVLTENNFVHPSVSYLIVFNH